MPPASERHHRDEVSYQLSWDNLLAKPSDEQMKAANSGRDADVSAFIVVF